MLQGVQPPPAPSGLQGKQLKAGAEPPGTEASGISGGEGSLPPPSLGDREGPREAGEHPVSGCHPTSVS